MIKEVSIKEVQYICFSLAKKIMNYDEPIPEFKTRSDNILESCLIVPFQKFSKKPLYKGLIGKAAVLFYLMIKNHPFQNGNKRIAITTLFYFLIKNNKWIKIDQKELYNFAIWIAQSPPRLKKETIQAIESFLKEYLVDL
jgi:death-on-curing family protein